MALLFYQNTTSVVRDLCCWIVSDGNDVDFFFLCASLFFFSSRQHLGEFFDIDVAFSIIWRFGQDIVSLCGKKCFFWFFVSFLCDGGMLTYLACAEFLTPGHQGVSQTVNRCMDYSGVNMVRLDLRILVAKTISFVELSKSIEDDVLLIGTLRSVSENSQEHGEVDWTWCFFDHRFKFSIGAKTTQ